MMQPVEAQPFLGRGLNRVWGSLCGKWAVTAGPSELALVQVSEEGAGLEDLRRLS